MASATPRKPFSAQPSAPPTLSDMLFGISSFCADAGKATKIRLAKTMRLANFMGNLLLTGFSDSGLVRTSYSSHAKHSTYQLRKHGRCLYLRPAISFAIENRTAQCL